jgi:hypothetical protein
MQKKVVLVALSVIAILSIVGAASAQEVPAEPTTPDAQAQVPPRPGQDGGRLGQGAPVLRELLQIVADDLSMEPRDVLEQLRDQSLADLIAAQNGDVAVITANVVAAMTERINAAVTDGNLTQERADLLLGNLEETVTNAINGVYRDLRDGLRGGDRPGQGGMRGGGLLGDTRPLINAAVEATGLTAQEIGQAVRSGQTLSEVITANGGDPAAVVSAAIATVTEKLDEAVTNGRITAEQESAMIGGLQAFYEAVLNGAMRPAEAPDAAGTI